MRTARTSWLVGSLLVVSVASCENRDPLAPVSARRAHDPSGTYVKPLNSSTVQVTWTDSSPNEISFRIERSASTSGSWTQAGTTDRNVASFDDDGRSSEQQVCYRVFAVFRNGLSNPSNTSCTIPPAAPAGLTATIVDHQAIDLAWTDNSEVEDGYVVERATAEAGPFMVVASLAVNIVSHRQSGLSTNTTYWFRVRASNDGGYGGYSNVASATPMFTVPAAPSALSARPEGGHVVMTWVDNAGNEDGFRFERSFDGGATWELRLTYPYRDWTVAYDYGPALEQTACYRVIAYNAQGGSVPSAMDCTAIPTAPSDLSATPLDQPAIDLSWSDNSNVEDGYQLWRTDGVTAFQVVANVPASSTSYRDAGVSVDITYRYYVVATRDGGSSYWSNHVTAAVATVPPNAPSNVHPIPWGSTAVGITWADNSINEDGFRIDRSTDGGASWMTVGTSWFAAYYPDQFVDGGRIAEAEVCYRAIAYNRAGESPASDAACTIPPGAPSNVVATQTPEGIQVTWSDNSAVEDGYYVVLITDCSEQPEWWELLPANSTSYLDTWGFWCFGPTLGYYVVATKDGGWSDFSEFIPSPGAAASARPLTSPSVSSLRRATPKH